MHINLMQGMELGIFTFGDIHRDPVSGARVSPEQNVQDLLERARLADQVGLHYFGVGEHHRPDYSVTSPSTVLAAVAAQTRQIKVGSAVTVLSTEDPVRVFQQFATLDLISKGRAELTAGRVASSSLIRCSVPGWRTTTPSTRKSWSCSSNSMPGSA